MSKIYPVSWLDQQDTFSEYVYYCYTTRTSGLERRLRRVPRPIGSRKLRSFRVARALAITWYLRGFLVERSSSFFYYLMRSFPSPEQSLKHRLLS